MKFSILFAVLLAATVAHADLQKVKQGIDDVKAKSKRAYDTGKAFLSGFGKKSSKQTRNGARCETVLDDVWEEKCETQYRDECSVDFVNKCATNTVSECFPEVGQKCKMIFEDRCTSVPVPECSVSEQRSCEPGPQKCHTVREEVDVDDYENHEVVRHHEEVRHHEQEDHAVAARYKRHSLKQKLAEKKAELYGKKQKLSAKIHGKKGGNSYGSGKVVKVAKAVVPVTTVVANPNPVTTVVSKVVSKVVCTDGELVCRSVPVKSCGLVNREKCIKVPSKKCEPISREVCREVPSKHCEDVERETCVPVGEKVCSKVTVKRPRQVCEGPARVTVGEIKGW